MSTQNLVGSADEDAQVVITEADSENRASTILDKATGDNYPSHSQKKANELLKYANDGLSETHRSGII